MCNYWPISLESKHATPWSSHPIVVRLESNQYTLEICPHLAKKAVQINFDIESFDRLMPNRTLEQSSLDYHGSETIILTPTFVITSWYIIFVIVVVMISNLC